MAEAASTARDRDGVIDLGGRKAVRAAAKIVAAVVLLEVAGLAAWWSYSTWRLGRIELINDGPPMTVQVLDGSGDGPIGEPVELVGRATLVLPDGDYCLRVTGAGRLGRTYRVAVNRGETFAHPVTLDDCRLLGEAPTPPAGLSDAPRKEPIALALDMAAIELTPGKADFIEWSNTSLSRRDGVTGQVVWDVLQPRKPGQPLRAYHPWLLWFAGRARNARLVEPAPDLDGDGTRDLVWSIPWGTAFLALSGKDGSVLWTYIAELDGPGGADPDGPDVHGPSRPAARPGYVLGQSPVPDLDRDGSPDLIVTVVFQETPAEIARRSAGQPPQAMNIGPSLSRRIVMAISGRSGKHLWSHAVDPAFTMPANPSWDKPPTPVPGRKASTVGILDGTAWRGLDPATGRPNAGPIDLGFEPVRPLQYADLDGDGEPEVIAAGPGTGPNAPSLAAFAIATGRPLWTAAVNGGFYVPYGMAESPAWPLVADLDGDGRPEIVVSDSGALDAANGYLGVRLIDGSSGRTRWTRPMRPVTKGADGLLHIVDAPDLDHDGVRDLVALSIFIGRLPTNANQGGPTEPERIYADALSGRDGRPLWWWHVDIPTDQFTTVTRPEWWGRGPDGWPLLAVSLNGGNTQAGFSMRSKPPSDPHPPMVYMLEASTGREVQTLRGLMQMHVADLDGDGLLDLWGDDQGELRAFRGEGPEAWRALGGFYPAHIAAFVPTEAFRPAADFDGDGIGDTLIAGINAPGEAPTLASPGVTQGSRTAVARSGRDGHLLWKARLDVRRGWLDRDLGESYSLTCFPLPAGDLDGDGTPDVLVQEDAQQLPIQAIRGPATLPLLLLSGRTGRPLWIAGPLPIDFEAHGYSRIQWAKPMVIEPNTTPDLLVRHDSPFLAASPTPPAPNTAATARLARVSGRTGRIVRDVPLEDQPIGPRFGYIPTPEFHDLDGDGGLDFTLMSQRVGGQQPEFELRALSPRDGRPLWSQTLTNALMVSPHVEIVDSGGGRRPVLVALTEGPAPGKLVLVVRAFDGRDGKPLWTWNDDEYRSNRPNPSMVTARPGEGKPGRVCLNFQELGGKRRIVVLDVDGREVVRRDLPGEHPGLLRAVDLDGDGRDELLVWHAGRLRAWGQDLKELWSWPEKSATIAQVFPASAGRPAELTLPGGLNLDGRTGQPRWKGQSELAWPLLAPQVLDPGDAESLPLLVSHPPGVTIVRRALPAAPDGTYGPPRGTPVPPGFPREDPRWTRLLPWTEPIVYRVGLKGFAILAGLALVNVMVPLGILRLATRRRVWSVRTLMALPVAAAVPLSVFQTFEPLIPAQIGTTPVSARIVFVLATLAGIPIVICTAQAIWNLVRGRWTFLAGMAGLTIVASAAIAAAWIWSDSRTMPAIEHYGRSGWPLVLLLGAYAVGALLPIGWMLRRPYRWLRRTRNPPSPHPIDAVPVGNTM
jgi:hypothetical protein